MTLHVHEGSDQFLVTTGTITCKLCFILEYFIAFEVILYFYGRKSRFFGRTIEESQLHFSLRLTAV